MRKYTRTSRLPQTLTLVYDLSVLLNALSASLNKTPISLKFLCLALLPLLKIPTYTCLSAAEEVIEVPSWDQYPDRSGSAPCH